MRGEYKVPGGKLVAVDVQVRDGQFTEVFFSGDFFLDPDEALEALNSALIGASADLDAPGLEQLLQRALDDFGDVQLGGFTLGDLAIAVRRALGHAVSWHELEFEVFTDELSPVEHVALDQVLAEEVGAGRRGPVFRVWQWQGTAAIIGSFQSLRNEIDSAAAEALGVQVIRRISGGGAMYMAGQNTITYSLIVPQSLVEGLSYEQSYSFLDTWVLGALAELGIAAEYKPLNDIASPEGKIAGAAQKRLASGVVLHHVTMSYDIDVDEMLQVLRIGREKLSDKGTQSANKRVDPLRSQTGLSREEIVAHLLEYFKRQYRTVEAKVRADEMDRVKALIDEKFASQAWTARVP